MKSGIQNGTEVTLELSSNLVGDSNNENNFLHKIVLANTQVSNTYISETVKNEAKEQKEDFFECY